MGFKNIVGNHNCVRVRIQDGIDAAYSMRVASCNVHLDSLYRHFNQQIRQTFGYHNSPRRQNIVGLQLSSQDKTLAYSVIDPAAGTIDFDRAASKQRVIKITRERLNNHQHLGNHLSQYIRGQ